MLEDRLKKVKLMKKNKENTEGQLKPLTSQEIKINFAKIKSEKDKKNEEVAILKLNLIRNFNNNRYGVSQKTSK